MSWPPLSLAIHFEEEENGELSLRLYDYVWQQSATGAAASL